MRSRPWLLGLVMGLASAGCSHATGSQADTPPAAAPTPAAAPPASAEQPETIEAEDIRVDLSPHGMAASISAPHDAKAHVTNDGVELQGGGGDFHLIVHRGALDPLAEKADIVKRYGVGFRRFVRDKGTEVVYETSFAGENRFHFFLTSDAKAPIPYHCRTPNDGIAAIEAVETMIEACRDIRFLADVEPAAPTAAGGDSSSP